MNATEKVLSIYTIDELKEIADHGCESGVCRQHIYYGDTIEFYDTFENDILDSLSEAFGTDFLVDVFSDSDADLTYYKNNVCWAFIEHVAFVAVDEEDERLELEDAKLAEYMTANVY